MTQNNLYYLVYFVGNMADALWDWATGQNRINKKGPYKNKLDVVNAAKDLGRAGIVYHAGNRLCLHQKDGFTSAAPDQLLEWAREHIPVISVVVKNDLMVEDENEEGNWALSKVKSISHTVEYTKFEVGVKEMAKLVKATIAAVIGDVPGVLNAVSDLTISICYGHQDSREGESWMKDITDNDGNQGIISFKAINETSVRRRFVRADIEKMHMSGVLFILVPLTDSARNKCNRIKNKHANTVIDQIEREFNFKD